MRGDKYGERALNAELDAGVSVGGGKYSEFELNPLPDARPDACGGGGTYDKLELTAEPEDSGGGCGGEYKKKRKQRGKRMRKSRKRKRVRRKSAERKQLLPRFVYHCRTNSVAQ